MASLLSTSPQRNEGESPEKNDSSLPKDEDVSATKSPPSNHVVSMSKVISTTLGKTCFCKNSKCLKMYCECFASGGYCVPSCGCANCMNTSEYEMYRLEAINHSLIRNPLAFRPKISTTMIKMEAEMLDDSSSHQYSRSRGCNCVKSHCLKNYCECYQAGVPCSDACRCFECCNKRITTVDDNAKGEINEKEKEKEDEENSKKRKSEPPQHASLLDLAEIADRAYPTSSQETENQGNVAKDKTSVEESVSPKKPRNSLPVRVVLGKSITPNVIGEVCNSLLCASEQVLSTFDPNDVQEHSKSRTPSLLSCPDIAAVSSSGNSSIAEHSPSEIRLRCLESLDTMPQKQTVVPNEEERKKMEERPSNLYLLKEEAVLSEFSHNLRRIIGTAQRIAHENSNSYI